MNTIEIWMVEVWRDGEPHDLVCFSGDRTAAGRFAANRKEAGYQTVAWDLMTGEHRRERR